MKNKKYLFQFFLKNFLSGFIIVLGWFAAFLGVFAFQSLTTNPSNSGNQSLGSPILTKSGGTFNRDIHSLEAIARFLWVWYSQGIKRMFITSQTYNGNLWWLSGADEKCQTAANSASLWGNWVAMLTDGTNNFTTRYPNSEKYYYVNLLEQPIFTNGLPWVLNKISQRKNASDYMSFNNITYENKVLILNASKQIWSNMMENWDIVATNHCTWWTTTSWNGYYWWASYSTIDGIWNPTSLSLFYNHSYSACTTLYSLRCIEI